MSSLRPSVAESTSPVGRVDFDALEASLNVLMRGYTDALRFIECLPTIGRVSHVESWQRREPQWRRRGWIGAAWRGLGARYLVRIFAETHIRRHLERIAQRLRLEGLTLNGPADRDRLQMVDVWAKRLDETAKGLLSWREPKAFVAAAPAAPLLLAIAVPLLTALIGFDVSSVDKAVGSLREVMTRRGAAHPFIEIASLFLIAYMLVAPLVTILGFRPKRAIFAGGVTVTSDPLDANPQPERWPAVPSIKIYQAENDVFRLLGVPKHGEFPADLVLRALPLWVIVVTGFLTAAFVAAWWHGTLPKRPWDYVGLIAFWIVLAGNMRTAKRNVALRRQAGEI